MEIIILIIHVVASAAVIGLILLQQGKGADVGASFGSGASQTVFGSQGTGSFMSRTTAALAAVFFVTSFSLAMVAKHKAEASFGVGVPIVEIEDTITPASGDAPLSVDTAAKRGVEGDAPVIDSTPVEKSE